MLFLVILKKREWNKDVYLSSSGLEFLKANVEPVHLVLKLSPALLQKVSVQGDLLEKALGGGIIVPLLIALVFFTCLVDTGVNVGHEKTDGFLDSRL